MHHPYSGTIGIGICSTEKYLYAFEALTKRLQQNLLHLRSVECRIQIIFSTDTSDISANKFAEMKKVLGTGGANPITYSILQNNLSQEASKEYKEDSQLLIAQLEDAMFVEARNQDLDFLWSVEPDVLPPNNALQVLQDTLWFDNGYYGVAMVTYPSQSGGGFLGGRGTPQHPIAEDYLEDERDIPKDLLDSRTKFREEEEQYKKDKKFPPEEWIKSAQELSEKIKHCPPKGNVWETTAKHGWRKRGWMEHAYPAIGRGAIVPTDWTGMGCTLLNKKAIAVSDFFGYEGKGTQDLFLNWQRWYPAGIKMAVIPHVCADHVVRARNADGSQNWDKFVLAHAYHESTGECEGHLRVRHVPWYSFEPGERTAPSNDGRIWTPAPTSVQSVQEPAAVRTLEETKISEVSTSEKL